MFSVLKGPLATSEQIRKSGMFKQFRVSGVLVEAVDLLTRLDLRYAAFSSPDPHVHLAGEA